jgi:hypothetical protein
VTELKVTAKELRDEIKCCQYNRQRGRGTDTDFRLNLALKSIEIILQYLAEREEREI